MECSGLLTKMYFNFDVKFRSLQLVKATPSQLRPNADEAMADLWAITAGGQTATPKIERAVREGVGAMRRKVLVKGALVFKKTGQETTGKA